MARPSVSLARRAWSTPPWATETSDGQTHSLEEIPLILAGGASGGVQMGRHVRSWTQDNVNKALLSVLRGMDMTLASLGDGDTYTEDGLSELEG